MDANEKQGERADERQAETERSGDGHGAQGRQALRKTLVGDEKITGGEKSEE